MNSSQLQNYYKYFASILFEHSLHIISALKNAKHNTFTVAFLFLNKTSCSFHAHVHTRTHSQRYIRIMYLSPSPSA